MKRLIPIFATALLACALPTDALARESEKGTTKKRSSKKQRVERTETRVRTAPADVIAVPSASPLVEERTPEGADTSGVARSTGAGIGESSTRSDVGTGRGGAGIVRSGTLAPNTTRPDTTTIITTAPAITTSTATGGTVVAPAIPRTTTNTGTLGAGTSTPVGVAPGR